MEVKQTFQYDFNTSLSRIDNVLNTNGDYTDVAEIPSRDTLTYTNGCYLNCYALFVDIRDSSQLPQQHQKKVLAKIYRSYISELTAIMQSFENCKEINIVGDCVSGIFTCTCKDDVMLPFSAAFTINAIVEALNVKLTNKGYSNIKIGIGLAKGKALMIQAGYKGSGLNDVVWMGDVVNHASNLCNEANKNWNDVIIVSDEVYADLEGFTGHLNVPYQDMLRKPYGKDYYTGNIRRTDMGEWVDKNK